MADEKDVETGKKYSSDEFKGLVRKNGQGWHSDKYGRMGLYVYLYNRVKGKPKRWGLDNEDVSFQLKDLIQNRFDEVVKEYIKEPIPGIDLTDPAQKARFLSEINEYNEHAQKIASPMPSTHDMSRFLQAVSDDKNSYFMTIHASVQEKSGEYMSDKTKKDSLIYERYMKNREIQKQKYDLRRDSFWTGLKGAGAAGSGALAVGAGIALFAVPLPLNLIVGLAGGATGFVGLRNFGLSFIQAVAKHVKMRQRLRDLKYKGGEKGDRGLKEIEKAIKFNRDLKEIMNKVKNMGKDGKMPTLNEFESYIKKHYPFVYKRIQSGEYMGNFKKLWEDSVNHYNTQDPKGAMRSVMGFMERHVVDVTHNKEIGIERIDEYLAMFKSGELDNDARYSLERDSSGTPVMVNVGGKQEFKRDTTHLMNIENWLETYNRFDIDKDAFQKDMPREYSKLVHDASKKLYEVMQSSIFEQAYEPDSTLRFGNYLANKKIEENLTNNPDGSKLPYIKNSVEFLKAEAKLDNYAFASGNQNHTLDGRLGVSVREQLFDNENLNSVVLNACKKLGASDGIVDSVVNELHMAANNSTTTKAVYDTIIGEINALAVSPEVRNYLLKIAEVKRDEAGLTTTLIDNEFLSGISMPSDIVTDVQNIKSLIVSYPASSNYSEIMQHIMSLYSADDSRRDEVEQVKAALNKALDAQIRSFETRDRNKARAAALDDIEHGRLNSNDNMEELFKEINELNFQKIMENPSDLMNFFNTKVVKASTPAMRNYLQMRLGNQVERILNQKLQSDPTMYAGENGLEKLRKDMFALDQFKFLTSDQKNRLMNNYSRHVGITLEGKIKTMQKDLFKPGNNFSSDFEDLFNKKLENGGLYEFLVDSMDKDSKDPGGRLDEHRRALVLLRNLKANEKIFETEVGEAKSRDGNLAETSLILRLLTTTDGKNYGTIESYDHSDTLSKNNELLKMINNMKKMVRDNFHKGDNLSNFEFNPGTPMKELYNHINNSSCIDKLDLNQRFVYLLMIKRQIATTMKAQIKEILKGHTGDATNYLTNEEEGRKRINALNNSWNQVCSKLEDEMNKVKEEIEATLGCEFTAFGGYSYTSPTQLLTQFLSANDAQAHSQQESSAAEMGA